jgi:hypothetical protein
MGVDALAGMIDVAINSMIASNDIIPNSFFRFHLLFSPNFFFS